MFTIIKMRKKIGFEGSPTKKLVLLLLKADALSPRASGDARHTFINLIRVNLKLF